MEELLELQRVKEKEQVEQTRSFKEATAEVKRQKHSQDEISQKVHAFLWMFSLYVHVDSLYV